MTFRSAILLLALLLVLGGAAPSLLFAQGGNTQSDFIKPTTPLPVWRAFHGSAVLGDYLYVMGGTVTLPEGGQLPALTTHVAKIHPDGTLSDFAATSKMAEPRHYISNSTLVYNDTVYVFGGASGILDDNCVNNVAWAQPQPNGMLGPWQASKPFTSEGLQCVAAFATPGFLHLTGGLGPGDVVVETVWSLAINADGSPGEWEQGPPMPAPLWFHCAESIGGRAYVWGGLNENADGARNPSDRIYSAQILSSGRLGPWREEPMRLPKGMYSAVSAAAGFYVFMVCPRYAAGEPSSDLWWSYVTPEGMRKWEQRPSPITNRIYRASATDYRHGIIYINGGKNAMGQDPGNYNFMIQLSPKARELAEQAWLAKQGRTAGAASRIDFARGDGSQSRLSFTASASNEASTIPGFFNLDAARRQSLQSKRPLVMYFNIEKAQPCQEQLQVIQSEGFQPLMQKAVFAAVSPVDYPKIAQDYGVFRVPTWLVYDRWGVEHFRGVGVQTPEQLSTTLASLQ